MSKAVASNLIAIRHSLTKSQAEKVLEMTLEGIVDTLILRRQIDLPDFGEFYVDRGWPAFDITRRTGETAQNSRRKLVNFNASRRIIDVVNAAKL